MTHKILLLLSISVFYGCAGVEDSIFHTKYQRSNWFNAGGYSEIMIQNDLWEVTFTSNTLLSKERVDYFALVRAAEICAREGKSDFVVASRNNFTRTLNYEIPGTVNLYSSGYGTSFGTFTEPTSASSDLDRRAILRIKLLDIPSQNSLKADQVLDGARKAGLKIKSHQA